MYCKLLVPVLLLAGVADLAHADDVPLGGFIPFVGIALTDEFETFDTDPTGAFFVADKSDHWGGSLLGPGSSAYYDVALLDTGAAAHILTQTASGNTGFDIQNEGFRGTNFQPIFGATGGQIDLRINDPMGIYTAGLGDRLGAGTNLTMDPNDMRGQTSVALLEGGSDWTLPNILGLPMAAQHGIKILNSDPQVFQHQGRTMRTPQVEFFQLGDGSSQGIQRRTDLKLRPSSSFTSGPLYVQNLGDIFNPHNNPTSPTIVDSGGLYLQVDVENNGTTNTNLEFLFDTGADLTVVSEVVAASMGFDVILDEPDFLIEVEGAGGVSAGVPGFYADELKIDAIGGSLVLNNVPMVVLNAPNPADPGNVIDAIIGMHVFAGRDLVIDSAPAALFPGSFPSLYISDPVTENHQWSTNGASGTWGTGSNWSAAGTPADLWIAEVHNVSGSNQTAVVKSDSNVFQLAVSGDPGAKMTVEVQSGMTLTTFGQALIETDGEVHLDGGKLDSQVVNIEGGALSGNGEVFAGTGPIDGVVRNLSGRIEPEGLLTITGDLSNLQDATIAMDLFSGGNDMIDVSRGLFLDGTLEVSLDPNFTPTVGQQFTLFKFESFVSLEFENTILPVGFDWNLFVDGGTDSVILEAVSSATIPGDFDGNGMVNHLDLAVWEAGYGSTYSGLDFLVWQQNLGAGSLQAVATVVPEPTTLVVLLCTTLGLSVRRGSKRSW